MTKILFDKETCSRCGGSGRYSFNMMDGDRCYGCSGSGQKLTRLGQKAFAAFEEALKIPQQALKVGDMVKIRMLSKIVNRSVVSFGEVRHIGSSTRNGVKTENYGRDVTFSKNTYATYHNDEKVQLAFTTGKVDRVLEALKGMQGYTVVEE